MPPAIDEAPPSSSLSTIARMWRRGTRSRISSLLLVVMIGAPAGLVSCSGRNSEGGRPTVTLTADPAVVSSGGVSTLTWSASASSSCTASGGWDGDRALSGRADTAPLIDAVNVFSLACVDGRRASRASVVVTVPRGRESGLDFPGSAATTETVRFRFTRPLAIYPATYIWRVNLRSQPEYYTAFFWGNDGEFRWDDNGVSNTYYGAHPYPYPAPNYVPPDQVGPRFWEISVAGLDVLSKQQVEYGRWHLQALRVWSDLFGKHHEFYWDLPDTTKVIKYRAPRSYGNKLPPRPALTWGDAPWAPSKEIMFGVMRGFQIYSTSLTMDDLLAEASHPLSTPAGRESVWYMNLNPTPTDIADTSGAGHHPEWVGAERPLLWTTR